MALNGRALLTRLLLRTISESVLVMTTSEAAEDSDFATPNLPHRLGSNGEPHPPIALGLR